MLKARYGRIINTSSIIGLVGNPGQTNYSASKSGLIGFTKSLAREIASRNITVNAIAPGYISTDMVETVSDKTRKMILDKFHVFNVVQVNLMMLLVLLLANYV